jgi:GTP cyclohydrolase I
MKNELLEQGVALILAGLEVDLDDHNFTDTPKRYAKALGEIFAQHNGPPTAFEECYTDFILVRGVKITTLCPHHLLPVRMRVALAYIPSGRVLGLSKLVRVMQQANTGPVMQERFTYAVRERLETALASTINGICIMVEGTHDCMALRGVKSDATTITMATSGRFDTEPALLDRFLLLTRGGR